MQVKKYPKADLGRASIIFFQIGLIIVLASTYFVLNMRTYDDADLEDFEMAMPDVVQEDVPITQLNTPPPPPPPPPPAIPEVIEVIEDKLEVEETTFQSTETSLDEKMQETIPIAAVEFEEEEEEIENVPFTVVEKIPVFPGCENLEGRDAKKDCMSQKIDAFVKKEFDTGISEELGLSGVNRIYVIFKINEKGNVVDIQARGPNKKLEEEAARVVNLLPKMIPGRQRDKPVAVVYSLPIMYEIRQRF